MSDWTAGYVADIGYTYGYYTELNPLRVRLAFLNAGLVPPEVGAACELGFGQGISANLHAAASLVQWAGTDFNPAQAGFAQELAHVADSGAQLFDEAFDQLFQPRLATHGLCQDGAMVGPRQAAMGVLGQLSGRHRCGQPHQ